MFRNLRVSKERDKIAPDPIELSLAGLVGEPDWPISIRSLNKLHDNVKRRVYRALIPHGLFSRFDIDPITWLGPDKQPYVDLRADLAATVQIAARSPYDAQDPFVTVELSDNRFNSVDLGLIVLSDPDTTSVSSAPSCDFHCFRASSTFSAIWTFAPNDRAVAARSLGEAARSEGARTHTTSRNR